MTPTLALPLSCADFEPTEGSVRHVTVFAGALFLGAERAHVVPLCRRQASERGVGRCLRVSHGSQILYVVSHGIQKGYRSRAKLHRVLQATLAHPF